MATRKQTSNDKPKARCKIRISKNGPDLVSGGLPLTEQVIMCDSEGQSKEWGEGKKYTVPENYALCRCGQSRNKPFCDGSHSEVHFDGSEQASREPYLDQAKKLHGPELNITDARALCAGARFCDRAGSIWNLMESDSPEAKELAIEEAVYCPSGRLVVWDKEGHAIEPELEPSIGVVEDPHEGVSGPIWVRGGVTVECADGTNYEVRNRVALCRCGRSSNKPFCDGSHLDSQER